MPAGQIREAPDGLERWMERQRVPNTIARLRNPGAEAPLTVYTSTVAWRTSTDGEWTIRLHGGVSHFDESRWEEFPLVFEGFGEASRQPALPTISRVRDAVSCLRDGSGPWLTRGTAALRWLDVAIEEHDEATR